MPAAEPANIEKERSKRFLRKLADHPFIAVVVLDDGKVEMFHKGIELEHVERIREALDNIEEKDADEDT